ncbi:unnamed protein product [Symbiodinium natans]|uniref:Uncharacterized protein n=1 Tax=Symbiodinium natans TaxID=878477 RepID=A0A812PDD3_9DINO|nr:unnamed protein product [Symbiodinium natans]
MPFEDDSTCWLDMQVHTPVYSSLQQELPVSSPARVSSIKASDPWAVRAVPVGGEIERIRVLNFGYRKSLYKVPLQTKQRLQYFEYRRHRNRLLKLQHGRYMEDMKLRCISGPTFASHVTAWDLLQNEKGASAARSGNHDVIFDLEKSDYIVAVEQAAVGNSGSLGAQLLFITASGRTLHIMGLCHRRKDPLPSRVRVDVHAGEQIVGLEVEFGRLIGVETALEPAAA